MSLKNEIETNKFSTTETQENRGMQATGADSSFNAGPRLVVTNLIRDNARKMNGKHSLVARTNIIVQKSGKLELLFEDAENFKEKLVVGEFTDLKMADFTATKQTFQTQRIGHAIEVTENLYEKSAIMQQEEFYRQKLINRIEDSLNFGIVTGNGDNMGPITVSGMYNGYHLTSVANEISLLDVLTIISKLNQEYRDGAVFMMNTTNFNKILMNVEFKDHFELAIDDFSGKKLYHLCGYPILVNDNFNAWTVMFGNLYEGYKTVISEGLRQVNQDAYGNKVNLEYRSFDLQKTSDSIKRLNGKYVYLVDAFVFGNVVNKDCFAKLSIAVS